MQQFVCLLSDNIEQFDFLKFLLCTLLVCFHDKFCLNFMLFKMYIVNQKKHATLSSAIDEAMAEDRVDFFDSRCSYDVHSLAMIFTTKVWCWFKSTRHSDWQKF